MASKRRLFMWASMSAKWAGEVSRFTLMWSMEKDLRYAGVVLGVRHAKCYCSGWEVGWLVGLVGMSDWVVLIWGVNIRDWCWEAGKEVEVVVVDMGVLVVGKEVGGNCYWGWVAFCWTENSVDAEGVIGLGLVVGATRSWVYWGGQCWGNCAPVWN